EHRFNRSLYITLNSTLIRFSSPIPAFKTKSQQLQQQALLVTISLMVQAFEFSKVLISLELVEIRDLGDDAWIEN
ncbi:hypothetical protein F442_11787, partial [Phytophthora nicotianae P10297]